MFNSIFKRNILIRKATRYYIQGQVLLGWEVGILTGGISMQRTHAAAYLFSDSVMRALSAFIMDLYAHCRQNGKARSFALGWTGLQYYIFTAILHFLFLIIRHGISSYWQLDILFDILLNVTAKNTLKPVISNHLLGWCTGDRYIYLTINQCWGRCFHAMPSL